MASAPNGRNSVGRPNLDVVDRVQVTRTQNLDSETCTSVLESVKQHPSIQNADFWLSRVKEKKTMSLLSRCVKYRVINESIRAVHEDGEDYEPFDYLDLWSRNEKQHGLALIKLETGQAAGKHCSTLLFAVKSFLVSKGDIKCTYVELFPGTELCKQLKVTSIGEELTCDETIKKCIVACKGVSIEIYPILKQIFRIQR